MKINTKDLLKTLLKSLIRAIDGDTPVKKVARIVKKQVIKKAVNEKKMTKVNSFEPPEEQSLEDVLYISPSVSMFNRLKNLG